MKYKHLTQEQRYYISAYKAAGLKQKDIAQKIGVHPSTVSREIRRNRGVHTAIYFPFEAHKKAKQLQAYKSKTANFKHTEATFKLVKYYLKKDFSPEQVAATLRLKHNITISHVTRYRHIYYDRLEGGMLYTHLRHKGKRRTKYGSRRKNRIPNVFISDKDPLSLKQKSASETLKSIPLSVRVGKE